MPIRNLRVSHGQRCLLALAAWTWGLCVPALATAAQPSGRVLLISLDGVSWEQLSREVDHLPVLSRFWRQGAKAPLTSVFPSLTWPAHTSMITGVTPGRHGILGNRTVDRVSQGITEAWQLRRDEQLRVATVDQAVSATGRTVASVLWPGTVGAAGITWNLPEVYGQAAFVRHASPGLLPWLEGLGLPVPMLDRLGHEEMFLLDSFVRDAAVELLLRRQPDLMLVHFVAVDTLLHAWGPGSRPARWGLELLDRYVGDLLAAAEKAGTLAQTDVLIVSDHGFMGIRHYADPEEVLASAVGARAAKSLQVAINGHALFVYAKSPLPDEDQQRLVDGARAQPEVASVLGTAELRALGWGVQPDPRVPDLVIVARPEYFWVVGKGRKYKGRIGIQGMHGSAPGTDAPELRGVFLALGPHVLPAAVGTVPGQPEVGVVDIAAIVAKLMGVTLPGPLDGRVPAGLLQ